MSEHERQHWSNWHITVNTNRHERTDEDRLETARTLADAIDDAIRMPELLWTWLLHFTGGRRVAFTDEETAWISRIRARVALEEGPRANNRSVHCHILLEVEHVTRVQVDQWQLARVLEQITGWTGINVKSRFVKGEGSDREYLLRYIQKDGVPTRRARDPENRRIQQASEVLEIEEHV